MNATNEAADFMPTWSVECPVVFGSFSMNEILDASQVTHPEKDMTLSCEIVFHMDRGVLAFKPLTESAHRPIEETNAIEESTARRGEELNEKETEEKTENIKEMDIQEEENDGKHRQTLEFHASQARSIQFYTAEAIFVLEIQVTTFRSEKVVVHCCNLNITSLERFQYELQELFPFTSWIQKPNKEVVTSLVSRPSLPVESSKTSEKEQKLRRSEISTRSFYGKSEGNKSLLLLHSKKTSKRWEAFHRAFTFNVKHSKACQLDGLAPVYQVFPLQSLALAYVNELGEKKKKGSLATPSCKSSAVNRAPPRIFSFEAKSNGRRKFLVSDFDVFWEKYASMNEKQRHVYEIIGEHQPCRLYFDLEYNRAANPTVEGDWILQRFLHLVAIHVYDIFGIALSKEKHFVDLDSSSATKFSHHIIVHFPGNQLFRDNLHVGQFVDSLIHRLLIVPTQGKRNVKETDTFQEATVHGPMSPFIVQNEKGKNGLIVDTGVYTRNRAFRVYLSSKYGSDRILQRAQGCSWNDSSISDRDVFMAALVCPVLQEGEDESQVVFSLLPFGLPRRPFSQLNMSTKAYLSNDPATSLSSLDAKGFHSHSHRSFHASSLFPMLDEFIRSQATQLNVQGEIHAWHLLETGMNDHKHSSLSLLDGQASSLGVGSGEKAFTSMLKALQHMHRPMMIYSMIKNRYCANIQRFHKSNNIMYIVDVLAGVFYQKCYDVECRAAHYKSPDTPLPPAIFSAMQHLMASHQEKPVSLE